MKKIIFIIAVLTSGVLTAQTKFTVNVANFSFTPANLTITVGDTVEFVNTSGVHWVDGRQVTFAANPVSFDNQSQSGSGWTYTQVFNTVGNYNYRCGIHTTTMTGAISVQLPTSITENESANKVSFYPNPASEELFFLNYNLIKNMAIYSLTGKKAVAYTSVTQKIDISSLNSGVYFVKLTTDKGDITKKLIIQ